MTEPPLPPPAAPMGPPPGYANSDEKTWVLLTHFGGVILGFIAPLVAVILMVCSFFVLFFLPIITWLVVVIFSIIAGMKANEGQFYRYPMTIRLVK